MHPGFQTGNQETCPYCKAQIIQKTIEEDFKDIMKLVKANNASLMCEPANYYCHGVVYSKMKRGQWNLGNRPQKFGPAGRIPPWVLSITKGEI
jgi:hypothetical protein